MFTGCIPAHALYFTVYESCKINFGVNKPGHHPAQAAMAGAIATICHDAIMTPMDVLKQRLQLGYYNNLSHCFSSIYKKEGLRAFYLSFPTTLVMNIPYGCVMVASNESLKNILNPSGEYNLVAYMLAGW